MEKTIRIRAHQLVAILFLDKPKRRNLCINHKDGNKLNNHYSNLEWCTYKENNKHARDMLLNDISKSNKDRWKDKFFREKTSKNISEGIINNKSTQWKNNGRFKYLIIDENNNEYSRKDLSEKLGLSLSYTDTLIRKYINGTSNSYFDNLKIKIINIKK